MKTDIKITPHEWPQGKDLAQVMAALQGDADMPRALMVGGCVRNALLGRGIDDIDIATILKPEEVQGILAAAGIKTVPTGLEHGTVTAVVGKYSFEITTLRRDVETDGRHAVIAFTGKWEEDAARRDFTINTLLAEMGGAVYDPLGRGLTDLQHRRVIFVGDPATRIAEDYLRILRFFRFYLYYGEGEPDAQALQACRAQADRLGNLSRERITAEFLKILAAPDPVPVLGLMFENDILKQGVSATYDAGILERLCGLQLKYDAFRLISRCIPLGDFSPDYLRETNSVFIFSNAQKQEFENILSAWGQIDADSLDKQGVKELIYRHGRDAAQQALLLKAACLPGRIDWPEDKIRTLKNWQAPSFPVTGEDVKKAGIGQGPAIGRILAETEQWWIQKEFKPERAECLAHMREIAAKYQKF